jgi:hypothetical protein
MSLGKAVLIALGALAGLAIASGAAADSDRLPTTTESFVADFRAAALRHGMHEGLTKIECLPGSSEKRAVCNYKVGTFAMLMSQTEKGADEITGVTAICLAQGDVDSMKCVLLDGVLMDWLAPDVDTPSRGKIMKVLIDGMAVANDVRVTNDETRFTLQKVTGAGLWFHVTAADDAD